MNIVVLGGGYLSEAIRHSFAGLEDIDVTLVTSEEIYSGSASARLAIRESDVCMYLRWINCPDIINLNPAGALTSDIDCLSRVLDAFTGKQITHSLKQRAFLFFGSMTQDSSVLPSRREQSPLSFYERNKFIGEELVNRHLSMFGHLAINIRLSNVYGFLGSPRVGSRSHFNRSLINLSRDQDITVPDIFYDLRRDFLYVGDVVNGLRDLIHGLKSGKIRANTTFNFSSGETLTIGEALLIAADVMGSAAEIKRLPPDYSGVPIDASVSRDLGSNYSSDLLVVTHLREGVTKSLEALRLK